MICVKPQVFLDERGNEVVTVVVAVMNTKIERQAAFLAGSIE